MFLQPKLRLQEPRPRQPASLHERLEKQWRQFKHQMSLRQRDLRFFVQRCLRRDEGWDDSDVWMLPQHFARLIYPRLLRFQQIGSVDFAGCDKEESERQLQVMCDAFYMIGSYEDIDYRYKQDVVQEGLDLFRRNFFDLWF